MLTAAPANAFRGIRNLNDAVEASLPNSFDLAVCLREFDLSSCVGAQARGLPNSVEVVSEWGYVQRLRAASIDIEHLTPSCATTVGSFSMRSFVLGCKLHLQGSLHYMAISGREFEDRLMQSCAAILSEMAEHSKCCHCLLRLDEQDNVCLKLHPRNGCV